MAVDLGKIMKLFVVASVPSGAFDSGDYTQLLLVQTMSFDGDKAVIDVSTRDNVFDTVNLSGRRTLTINIGAVYNFTGDTGQEILETAFLATTQAAAKIWWLLTTDVAGDKEHAGTGIVGNYSRNFDDESPATLSFTIATNTGDMSGQDVP